MLTANLVISEMMAANKLTLTDQDGDHSDWIEIHNPTGAAVDLAGWHLTDDPTRLTKWEFPAVNLDAGGYLVVFASEKDRRDTAQPLHTNFKLDGNGEYLALVEPDGATVVSAYAPQFPRQKEDLSYGFGQDIATLVTSGATAAAFVPANGNLGITWTSETFSDTAWLRGPTGLGFEVGEGQQAATAYSNKAGNVGSQEYGGPLGLDFYVNRPITVTRLGVFDSGSNGLSRNLTAQIWTRNGNTGTLVTHLAFTSADPGVLVGGDRFKSLASPLVLQPGEYTVVAYGYGEGEPNGNTGGPAAADKSTNDGSGAIEFEGTGRYGSTPGTFPATLDGGPVNRYSAGTFEFLVPAYTELIRTDLKTAMYGRNASVYSRLEFNCADPSTFSSLSLRMKYDDGFVAYLNGAEVARRNAPADPQWNSAAVGPRPVAQAIEFENINITQHLGLLHAGQNVLAIQGLNAAAGDSDFLMLPELVAASAPGSQLRYFDVPTPGAPNNSASSFTGFVEETQLSIRHGFFDAPFDLAITTPTDGARVYYTLNGTIPSPTNGTLYQTPIRVGTTTTLRAAAYKDGFVPTQVNTETYLFLDSVIARTGVPAGYPATWNGGFTADYGMSQNTAELPAIAGNTAYTTAQAREAIKSSLRSLPTMSIVLPPGDLFDPTTGIYVNPTGRDSGVWEKACSIEYLLPDGTPGFEINGGVQIMGYTSRSLANSPKLSMRLLFKKQYGEAKLDYPFFSDSPVESYNTITLRSNGRDSWLSGDEGTGYRSHALMIRNQWADLAQKEMDEPATSGNFVHLYLNGMYWGVYNPTERPDADFCADYLGGEPEEYDVVKFCFPRAIEGDMVKFNELMNLAAAGLGSDAAYQRIQGNNPDGTRNPNYEILLDVDNLIDYIINGQYHASIDWPGNYYMARKRGPDSTGFKFFTWDNDLAMPYEDVNRNKTVSDNNVWWDLSPGRLDIALRANAEYRLRFADHVQRHLFNGGSLTPQAASSRFTRIADQLRPALAAESARWGDYRRDVAPAGSERMLHTPSQWQAVVNTLLTGYFPNRTNVVLNQLRAVGLYPTLAAPTLGQFGGSIPAGFALSMSAPVGSIYYTLDGSDPRRPGGTIRGTRYTGPVVLQESTLVKARVLNGSQWSALIETVFLVDGRPRAGSMVVTELNYHPTAPTAAEQTLGFTTADDFEFIELTNISATQSLDLHGVRFTAGVTFDFNTATITSVAPGQRVLLVRNQPAFEARYGAGLPIAGQYAGGLSKSGERITLEEALTGVIADFTYQDGGVWPGRPDGKGSSLELVGSGGSYNDPNNWRASAEYNGTPGAPGVGPMADVIINEVLAHSTMPLVDAIELYNPTAGAIDIGGWCLSDSSADYLKFRIPDNSVIEAGGYFVFYQGHWADGAMEFAENEFGGGPTGFGLDCARGDDVYLIETDSTGRVMRFADHVDFGATANGESLGRWRDDEGNWRLAPMLRRTLEAPNNANATDGNGPRVGPLLISEVMYAPKPLSAAEVGAGFITAEDMEFIEVHNPTSAAVPLVNWRLDKAVDYTFSEGLSLPAGGTLVVVPFDPANASMLAAFRNRYLIGGSVTVLGPYQGRLSNGGDRVQLERPDAPPLDDPNWFPPVLEDAVAYSPSWGANAADGKSLQRVAVDAWGDYRASWGASAASPGTVHLVAGRYAFYNNSAFDGRSDAAETLDDQAIARDKQALLPGRRATFDNYTSYHRGLNGIMLDLTNPSGAVVAGDFIFRIGNDDAPSAWTTLAIAPTVTTRTAAGLTRVTLIWPEGAIRNQWLEVTVRSGPGTHAGLASPDVFYFGNAIGETGDRRYGTDADAAVDTADESLARTVETSSPALITSPYDFNRDRRVNATDVLIARDNYRQGGDALQLIDLTLGASAGQAVVAATGAAAQSAKVDARDAAFGSQDSVLSPPCLTGKAQNIMNLTVANDEHENRTVKRGLTPEFGGLSVERPPRSQAFSEVMSPELFVASATSSARAAAYDRILATPWMSFSTCLREKARVGPRDRPDKVNLFDAHACQGIEWAWSDLFGV